ncbi:MAG TPA: response regulator [Vicinamibacterales bacterium]|jgi:two-component system CheB/CheR fusion protein|nr:response regulator [Vicinamibacterales bacterium]
MADKQRILLVDDYPDALEMWSLYLQLAGYDVATAENGREAVRLALANPPDLVVMDLELPGLTGIEAARLLRQSPATARVPLIAATGYSHSGQLEAAERAGFNVVLVKPCDPAALVREIGRLLGDEAGARGGQQPAASG